MYIFNKTDEMNDIAYFITTVHVKVWDIFVNELVLVASVSDAGEIGT